MVGDNTTLHCHLSPEKNAEDMEVRWFRSQFSPAVLVYKGRRERTEEQMEEYQGRTTFVSTEISKGSVALVIHNVTAHENSIYHCYFQEGRSYDEAIMRLMVAGESLQFFLFLFPSFSPNLRPIAGQQFYLFIYLFIYIFNLQSPLHKEGGLLLSKGHENGLALLSCGHWFLKSIHRTQLLLWGERGSEG
jgi:hypothetical protein